MKPTSLKFKATLRFEFGDDSVKFCKPHQFYLGHLTLVPIGCVHRREQDMALNIIGEVELHCLT